VKSVDHIFVVVEEARSHLINIGADKNKISIVSNTPEIKRIDTLASVPVNKKYKGKIVLLYQGYVNKARGLENVIEAIPLLKKDFPEIFLIIIGNGDDLDYLKSLSIELKIEDHIEFTGWIEFDQIPPMIMKSDICIIPHNASDHKNTTIPHSTSGRSRTIMISTLYFLHTL